MFNPQTTYLLSWSSLFKVRDSPLSFALWLICFHVSVQSGFCVYSLSLETLGKTRWKRRLTFWPNESSCICWRNYDPSKLLEGKCWKQVHWCYYLFTILLRDCRQCLLHVLPFSIADIRINIYPDQKVVITKAIEVERCDCPRTYYGSSCEVTDLLLFISWLSRPSLSFITASVSKNYAIFVKDWS